MIDRFANGFLEWQTDPGLRVVFTRWAGDFNGEELLAAFAQAWNSHPELAGYGAIHDQIEFTGTIEHSYYPKLRRAWVAFCGNPAAQNRSAIVSGGALKFLEVKLLGLDQDAGTLFGLFPDNASALRWVTADDPGNPSAGGKPSLPLPRWFDRGAPSAGGGAGPTASSAIPRP